MKSKSKSSPVLDRYGMIEALEQRIAPASAAAPVFGANLPANPTFVTVTAGGTLLLKAGDVLTTGSGGGGIYLFYVQAGEVLVHTTDLNGNNQFDFNELTGLSVGNGARFTSFVDIHGDIVTDLNPDGSLSDGGKGDILLDSNIAAIDMRSLTDSDFTATSLQSQDQLLSAHLAMTSYSIYGNIYAGGGLGVPNDTTSGLHINPNDAAQLMAKYPLGVGTEFYQPTEPVVGSIYAGSSATGQAFTFGASGQGTSSPGVLPIDLHGNLLAFTPAPGQAGASIYNIQADIAGTAFSIGTIHAGDGGFNAPGGNIVNVALDGDNAGVYKLIAGNAGNGTIGQSGGSIINFGEASTIISEVVLQSGNGGSGLVGAGGNAGIITYNPANPIGINAHFLTVHGNGGDGYTKGGAGGGASSGTFVTPEGKITQALDLVTTMHTIGTIGSRQSFDFNNDGLSDAVFSTTNPNQVVVALGVYTSSNATTPYGLDAKSYIYLNSPAQVDSIVVGDFTGAINPVTGQPELDIAVASGAGSLAGIEVYISQYNPKTGAFEGFSDPLFSPLPILSSYFFDDTPITITKLLAGDFTGNGKLGLAVLAQEQPANGGGVTSVLMFLNPETDNTHPLGTGYFYANFANTNQPFVNLGVNPIQSTFLVTALQTFAPGTGHDVVVFTDLDARTFSVIQDDQTTVNTLHAPEFIGGGAYGTVLPPGDTNFVQFFDKTITVTESFNNHNVADVAAVSDNPQGFIVYLTGNGGGAFTVASPAVGIDFGYNSTIEPVAAVSVPNTFGPNPDNNYNGVAILDYDTNGGDFILIQNLWLDPTYQPFGFGTPTPTVVDNANTIILGTIAPNNRSTDVAFDAYIPHPVASNLFTGSGPLAYGFITGDPGTAFPDPQEFGINQPIGTGIGALHGGLSEAPFKDAGYFFTGGNGGNSLAGSGGAGGSFGQSLSLTNNNGFVTGTGTFNVELPQDPTFGGTVSWIAGNGGNGFTNGGAGGTLAGLSLTYNNATTLTGSAALFGGNGGESLTGTGGAGGSLSQLYIVTGELYIPGNGGIGTIGGAGGSMFGNTQPGVITGETNSYDAFVVVRAGNGANGILGGGAGGSVNSFVNWFAPIIGASGGLLNYTGGSGGDAVAGQGGTGGSVVNSSPYVVDNNLAGNIFLGGGSGGTGQHGGGGGSVTNFDQVSTISDIPMSATVIAGNGGNSTLGAGGAGGGISNIDVSASGDVPLNPALGNLAIYFASEVYNFNLSNPAGITSIFDVPTTATPISYNRMVAGFGGSSLSGSGGVGGSVSTIQTAAVAAVSQAVLAAGAGGAGMTAGGAGGNVTSANVDAGSTLGKVLVIAGDGGAATGAKPLDPNSPQDIAVSIGATSGPGGNGGSILGVTQPASLHTHVDLIAGNGGATPNHSLAQGNVSADNSGHGGSITNISVAGSIGNSAPGTAIISYNNIFTGTTSTGFITGTSMQDFVDNYILGDITAPLTDAVGNVGLVAGEAGFVQGFIDNQPTPMPSSSGVNGSVTNVHAENIMSMVAGNVNQVALIQSLTDYGSTISNGTLGASKYVWFNPLTGVTQESVSGVSLGNFADPSNPDLPDQYNYIGEQGDYSTTGSPLPGGGMLIDGAFIAMNVRTFESNRDFQGTE